MNTPLLSIIVPYYNLDLWLLQRCIESILSQNLEEKYYEIIVIDDGSDISPKSLIESYQRENITCFYQSNQGLSEARNSGLKLAKGKYIQFIDSDDYLYENILMQCVDLLEAHAPDVLNFRFKTCYKAVTERVRQTALKYEVYENGASYINDSKVHLLAVAWGYIFKKEVVEKNNLFFTKGIFHEDEEFTPLLYIYSGKVISTNLVVYAYYQREGSIVGRKDEAYLAIRYAHFKRIIEKLQHFKRGEDKEISELQRSALEKRVNLLACDYIISMSRNKYPFYKLLRELDYLKSRGLYPLPDKKYTFKYSLYRFLFLRRSGVKLFYRVEPLRDKLRKL